MNRIHVLTIALLAFVVLHLLAPPVLRAEETFVTIGTGDFSGVYFPTGRAIAGMINDRRAEYGIRASAEATRGTLFNLNSLQAGNLEFGLAQADDQFFAVNGQGTWAEKGPQRELRAVLSLYGESVTLVAAVDAGIATLADLKGKRVSLGSPSSSQRQIVIDALQAAGIDADKDLVPVTTTASAAPALLQDRVIDAYFFVVGHPSESIRKALAGERRARIVEVSGPGIDRLAAEKSYYARVRLPIGRLYPGLVDASAEVETLGVLATLCTSVRVPDRVVYDLTKIVFDNLDELKRQHPALAGLTREGLREGLSAPLHPGALQFYRETGLLK
jgi:TRAP transporter TAXI family solute receptor